MSAIFLISPNRFDSYHPVATSFRSNPHSASEGTAVLLHSAFFEVAAEPIAILHQATFKTSTVAFARSVSPPGFTLGAASVHLRFGAEHTASNIAHLEQIVAALDRERPQAAIIAGDFNVQAGSAQHRQLDAVLGRHGFTLVPSPERESTCLGTDDRGLFVAPRAPKIIDFIYVRGLAATSPVSVGRLFTETGEGPYDPRDTLGSDHAWLRCTVAFA
jgi:endonuclease/exonuclease/phosphatase family metal-dependent hydrolase